MKKLIPIFTLSFIFIMLCLLTASSQEGKGKGNGKEKNQQTNGSQKADQGKGYQKMDDRKDDQGKKNQDQRQNGKDNGKDRGHDAIIGNGKGDKNSGKGNNGKDDRNEYDNDKKMNNNNGKKDRSYYNSIFGYNWNNENFKERRKLKKHDKVSICHKFSAGDGVNINVSENAMRAHLNHGDVIGNCPNFNDRRYSNIFYDNRQSYYNNLQNTQEQVVYSQSILDYALARLTNSRSQLQVMQNNRLPVADIQRKQESVVQLEQNVSLLETLIGVAVSVVANQL